MLRKDSLKKKKRQEIFQPFFSPLFFSHFSELPPRPCENGDKCAQVFPALLLGSVELLCDKHVVGGGICFTVFQVL